MKDLPSQEHLKSILNYDELSGIFTWRKIQRGISFGAIAGSIHKKQKYLRLSVDNVVYAAHRLAWVYVYGSINNEMQVDHINGIRSDNRIANLRLVDHKTNGKNQRKSVRNINGFCGVFFSKEKNKYVARIKVDKKSVFLGYFKLIDDAIEARKAANVKYGFHENHGKNPSL